MKTLKTGTIPPPPAPWWVGEILNCANCSHELELEEGDPVKEVSERRQNGVATLTIDECPTCGLAITKTYRNRPLAKKTR